MLLRRLTHSLRVQNWTAIVIEFVLLVSGVFLGIQVANWNQDQQDHRLEAELIGRLGRDFEVIDARLADNVSRWEEKTTAALQILADLDAFQQQGAWPRSKADTLATLNNTFDYRIPAPRAATYIELLSAGRLGLIRSARLRDALLAYDIQVGYSQTAFNVLVQRVEPYLGTIVAHLDFDQNKNANASPSEANTKTNVWADVDLEQLARDPKLKEAMNMYASASRNQLLVAKLQQEKARDVIAALKPGARP